MEWQLTIVGLLVAAALCYVGRELWRSWQVKKSGCGGGCGCRDSKAVRRAETTTISTERLSSRLHSQRRAE